MESSATYCCTKCGASETDLEGSVTMFAKKNGWALSRRFEDGKLLLEWHCAKCWASRPPSGTMPTARKA